LIALPIIKPVSWIKLFIYALLLLSIYYSSLTWLVLKDWTRDAYSYAYLIPFVVLYIIWDKRKDLASLPSAPSWKGLIPITFGLMLFWLGELGGEYLTLYLSLWFLLVGLCLLHLGWQKLKTIAFAFFFILTMFPFPNFIYTKLTLKLRLISSQLGVAMINLYGMPVHQEGNIIDLGFTQLQVVEACSGLHSLISLVVLGLFVVYFFKAQFWKRAILLISTVPLAILTNSLRITVTAILYEVFDARVAEGFFHGFSGWLIFMFCIPILLVEMWLLDKVPPSRSGRLSESTPYDPPSSQGYGGWKDQKKLPFKGMLQANFIVALILLGTTLAISQGVEFREMIPIKEPLNRFPLEVGEWSGDRQTMEQMFIDALDLSDYVEIDYRNSAGKSVNLYVAYYQSQRKGESIHSPATCLPGSGWDFKQSGPVTVPLSTRDGKSIEVNRAFMQKAERKQLVHYWFLQRGRVLTNAYQLKFFVFWDSLTKQRTDGALVRLVTSVYENEGIKEAEERLKSFTREIIPILDQYIPGKNL
jgi:exosortase D (VPLPA-CTERM-specific)